MTVYATRVDGRLDLEGWASATGLTITDHGEGATQRRGALADVTALQRVLLALRARDLPVLTVRRSPIWRSVPAASR